MSKNRSAIPDFIGLVFVLITLSACSSGKGLPKKKTRVPCNVQQNGIYRVRVTIVGEHPSVYVGSLDDQYFTEVVIKNEKIVEWKNQQRDSGLPISLYPQNGVTMGSWSEEYSDCSVDVIKCVSKIEQTEIVQANLKKHLNEIPLLTVRLGDILEGAGGKYAFSKEEYVKENCCFVIDNDCFALLNLNGEDVYLDHDVFRSSFPESGKTYHLYNDNYSATIEFKVAGEVNRKKIGYSTTPNSLILKLTRKKDGETATYRLFGYSGDVEA